MLSTFNILKKQKSLFLSLLFLFIFLSISQTILSKKDESIRIRSLLEIIPRYKGRAYSNKININFQNNGKFTCKVLEDITPKEFSFLSTSSYSICSDKLYEGFDLLAKKISAEVVLNKSYTLLII